MKQYQKTNAYGLLPTPHDERDFPFEVLFGSTRNAELPRSFMVDGIVKVKDQGNTDMCSAYALTAVSEDQEGIVLNPFYTFGQTKQIMGGDPFSWGADLRSACKSAVYKHGGGFLAATAFEFDIQKTATEDDRHRAVTNIIKRADAQKHAKRSYFRVSRDISQDTFDAMRSAMWQARDDKRSIFAGIDWFPEWNSTEAVVRKPQYDEFYGHALKVFGWDGDMMIAQLSNGKEIGDEGVFYLPRDIVNAYCRYGAYVFMDLPPEQVEHELGRIGYFRYWIKSIFS